MPTTSDARAVVVTGAAGGIGSAVVEELVGLGYVVAAMDADRERVAALGTSYGERVLPIAVDVTDSAQVRSAVERAVDAHGVPHGLVNLAGNNILKPLPEITDDEWHFLVDVNLTSTFYLCRAVMPLMAGAGGGRVVNTSSIFGLRGEANDAAYAAAKAGVVGLSRALAVEYAPHGVVVNSIAPVVTLTERVARMPAEHLDRQLRRIPLGRFCELPDLTRTVAFLLGDGGSYYTGQVFSPNGGDVMP